VAEIIKDTNTSEEVNLEVRYAAFAEAYPLPFGEQEL
jgi:hypothetical protein